MHTYKAHPVEILQDLGNGITRIRFLDAKKAYRARLQGESDAEHAARLASAGIWDVATHLIQSIKD